MTNQTKKYHRALRRSEYIGRTRNIVGTTYAEAIHGTIATDETCYSNSKRNVLNVFINIQTSKELIQMDTDKMMTYGTFTMDDEKLTQS